MVTRHEFLARLHHLLQPKFYLEIGVQTGESLRLASCPAWGVDPYPQVQNLSPEHHIFPMTSDEFFDGFVVGSSRHGLGDYTVKPFPTVDLAFIDGMHLWEFAMRDFISIEKHSHSRTVVVFDDVLPYSAEIATREQPPGDWTGDVWRAGLLLELVRDDLSMMWVDTAPTGTLVVWDLNPSFPWERGMLTELSDNPVPPQYILDRTFAVSADEAIEKLKERL